MIVFPVLFLIEIKILHFPATSPGSPRARGDHSVPSEELSTRHERVTSWLRLHRCDLLTEVRPRYVPKGSGGWHCFEKNYSHPRCANHKMK